MTDKANMSSDTRNSGSAGTITIDVNRFEMGGGTSISSQTLRGGSGGIVQIVANEHFKMYGDTQINTSAFEASHPAGNVSIITNTFEMVDDATINTTTNFEGSGNGGNISIDAKNFSLSGTVKIMSGTFNQGNGGNINIRADTMSLSGKSAISSTTFGQGNAGNINIQAYNDLSFIENAVIDSSTQSKGNGGNITLTINQITMTDRAKFNAGSDVENAFIEQIKGFSELAQQLGAESSGDFSGGGQGGRICISKGGGVCDSEMLFMLSNRLRAAKFPLLNCANPKNKSSLVMTKPEGLLSSPDELFR
jgi:large exoprotein involved in heme utilization and adhesion